MERDVGVVEQRAEGTDQAQRDHIQCHHQFMREGRAVDHNGDLAAGEAATGYRARKITYNATISARERG